MLHIHVLKVQLLIVPVGQAAPVEQPDGCVKGRTKWVGSAASQAALLEQPDGCTHGHNAMAVGHTWLTDRWPAIAKKPPLLNIISCARHRRSSVFSFPFTAGRQPTCFHDEDRLPGQLRRRGIAALDLGNRAQAFPHEARHIVEHALRAMG